MKRALSVLLVVALVLGLWGCSSEGAEQNEALYEKYAGIIDKLENKDYNGAISDITQMAAQENQEEVERTPILQTLCGTWYINSYYDYDGPETVEFRDDGTCTLGGTNMTWLTDHESDTNARVNIYEDGVWRYSVYISASDEFNIPNVNVNYVEEHNGNLQSGDTAGVYYKHPLLGAMLTGGWSVIDERDPLSKNIYIYQKNVTINDLECDWEIADSEASDTLMIHAKEEKNGAGSYTLLLEMRDAYPILTVTDDATGKQNHYYSTSCGYDKSWIEFRYVAAVKYLQNYMERGSFSVETQHYDLESGISYLYDLFAALGDYADCPQILADWDSVRHSRASRYLNNYLDNDWIYVNDNRLIQNEALEFIYAQFSEIRDYGDSAQILSRFTVLPQMFTGAQILKVDNLGNQREDTYMQYEYDPQGRVITRIAPENWELYNLDVKLQLRYDDAGVLSELQYGNITAILTPIYDEQGRMISVTARYNDGTYNYTYTYNEAGLLSASEVCDRHYTYNRTYSYDDAGKLLQMVLTYKIGWLYTVTTDYTYDASGRLIGAYTVWTQYNDIRNEYRYEYFESITYTYDEQGRVYTAEFATDNPNDQYASKVATYTYKDLYFYDPEG